MKYWELIAGKLSAQGRFGSATAAFVSSRGWRWTVDAHQRDGRRYIVESDELLSAFLKLEATLL
jgi:hypothetical protein